MGQFYNSNFINVSFDGEQEEGLKFVKKYYLTGYPSLLFFDASGNVVIKSVGYQNVEEFIALGKSISR